MIPQKTVGSLLAGAAITVVTAVVLLPFLGLATAHVVKGRVWAIAVPLTTGATIGGAFVGYLQDETRRRGAVLGCMAAASGLTVIGAVLGLVVLVIAMGMTPAHGQELALVEGIVTFVTLGGGAGLLVGAVFGTIGGVGGHVGRQRFGS